MRDLKTSSRRRPIDKVQDKPRRAMQEFNLGQEAFGKTGSLSVIH
ncbi:MAG: hypothetical protein ACE5HS_02245 [bacterium]